ncbi:MAG: tryptophan-rich sensory protein [Nanoarchaeota archaeon]|nr:tryptophan-rich sensory protein [Nanoarchaeota archaeon]
MKKRINWKVLIISLILVYSVAIIGSLFTSPVTNSEWYESVKPSITPPNWIFPIVWNILFFLIALSLYFSWINTKNKLEKKAIIIIFSTNFILNILWSILYFGLKSPFYAFIEIFFLWSSIVLMIYFTHKINKKSSYLLIPYLLWVSFAIILNYFSF